MAADDADSNTFPRFKTETGRARYLAAYDAVVSEWPVACQELDLPTRLGSTHVIASGPTDAPPLVYQPQATLDLACARMPMLKTALVADADHIAAMAQPDAVNRMIVAFLQEQDGDS